MSNHSEESGHGFPSTSKVPDAPAVSPAEPVWQVVVFQFALIAGFGGAGVLLFPGLGNLARIVFILSMMTVGASFGSFAVLWLRKDFISVLPAVGQLFAGSVLAAISATMM